MARINYARGQAAINDKLFQEMREEVLSNFISSNLMALPYDVYTDHKHIKGVKIDLRTIQDQFNFLNRSNNDLKSELASVKSELASVKSELASVKSLSTRMDSKLDYLINNNF